MQDTLEQNLHRVRTHASMLGKRTKTPEFNACDTLRLVRSGTQYFDLLESLIRSAQQIIHLQAYIFEEDDTGHRIALALEEAAERGVQVFLLVDGYASQSLSDSFVNGLRAAGINFRFFDPLLKSKYFYFGRRLHHKIFTVDNQRALVGGINISNNYNDTVESTAWLDWALYVEGKVASELSAICARRVVNPRRANLDIPIKTPAHPKYNVRIRINDWVRRKRQITRSYLDMLRKATSHVTIMSSYFLPGKELKRNLSIASKRGIKIRVIMGRYSDVTLARHAERYMYRWLLRNKIEIYEYLPNVVHSKLGICDGKWLTVGSYNVNDLSAYASIELNLDLVDKNFVGHVEEQLNQIIHSDCVLITEKEYKMRNTLWDQFLQRSAYDIFRILLFLFTFYFKQRE